MADMGMGEKHAVQTVTGPAKPVIKPVKLGLDARRCIKQIACAAAPIHQGNGRGQPCLRRVMPGRVAVHANLRLACILRRAEHIKRNGAPAGCSGLGRTPPDCHKKQDFQYFSQRNLSHQSAPLARYMAMTVPFAHVKYHCNLLKLLYERPRITLLLLLRTRLWNLLQSLSKAKLVAVRFPCLFLKLTTPSHTDYYELLFFPEIVPGIWCSTDIKGN